MKFYSQFNKRLSVMLFYTNSFHVPKYVISKIYLSYILLIIEYCHISYFHTNRKLFKKLSKLNKKLLLLTNLSEKNFKLELRLCFTCIKFAIDLYHSNICSCLTLKTLKHSSSYYDTRSICNTPTTHLSIYKHSFSYWTANLLNILNSHKLLDSKSPNFIMKHLFINNSKFNIFAVFL